MTVAVSIHASAVLIGARAVLIRGPSGAGKSRLALALLQAEGRNRLPFVRLVADDRTIAEAAHERLLLRPAPNLAGLLEIRGLGIRHFPHEPLAVAFMVVDLGADAVRMPDPDAQTTTIEGITLPRLAAPTDGAALPLLLALTGALHGPAGAIPG